MGRPRVTCWQWISQAEGLAKDYGEAAGRSRRTGILPASKACKMHALRGPVPARHKELPYPQADRP
jgi:hypothetical protein